MGNSYNHNFKTWILLSSFFILYNGMCSTKVGLNNEVFKSQKYERDSIVSLEQTNENIWSYVRLLLEKQTDLNNPNFAFLGNRDKSNFFPMKMYCEESRKYFENTSFTVFNKDGNPNDLAEEIIEQWVELGKKFSREENNIIFRFDTLLVDIINIILANKFLNSQQKFNLINKVLDRYYYIYSLLISTSLGVSERIFDMQQFIKTLSSHPILGKSSVCRVDFVIPKDEIQTLNQTIPMFFLQEKAAIIVENFLIRHLHPENRFVDIKSIKIFFSTLDDWEKNNEDIGRINPVSIVRGMLNDYFNSLFVQEGVHIVDIIKDIYSPICPNNLKDPDYFMVIVKKQPTYFNILIENINMLFHLRKSGFINFDDIITVVNNRIYLIENQPFFKNEEINGQNRIIFHIPDGNPELTEDIFRAKNEALASITGFGQNYIVEKLIDRMPRKDIKIYTHSIGSSNIVSLMKLNNDINEKLKPGR